MFHNQAQQDRFDDVQELTPYECYKEQWGSVQGKWGNLDGVLWLAMIGATEHAAQRLCTPQEYLRMMDAVMALAGQLPECMAEQFRQMWDDAFPTMKGRY